MTPPSPRPTVVTYGVRQALPRGQERRLVVIPRETPAGATLAERRHGAVAVAREGLRRRNEVQE